MNKENDILKWFDGEISTNEMKLRYPSEDFSKLEKMRFYSKQMSAPKIDAEKALEAFKQRSFIKKEPKVIALNFKTFMKVAAILVIMLTSSYFVFFNNTKSFETQIAQTEILTLPDASRVTLNAQSTLKYNKKSWKNKRDLELDGEAFFKVSKGQKFTVNTDVGMVQVLGTQFNVKERAGYFEVKCYEGLVAVTFKNKTVKLSKGKSFRVVNGEIQVADDFKSGSPSWMEAESSFDKIPLNQVIAELERQYDLKVRLDDIDERQLFTGTFTHKNKDIALQSITIPLKLSYKIEGNNVTFYRYE